MSWHGGRPSLTTHHIKMLHPFFFFFTANNFTVQNNSHWLLICGVTFLNYHFISLAWHRFTFTWIPICACLCSAVMWWLILVCLYNISYRQVGWYWDLLKAYVISRLKMFVYNPHKGICTLTRIHTNIGGQRIYIYLTPLTNKQGETKCTKNNSGRMKTSNKAPIFCCLSGHFKTLFRGLSFFFIWIVFSFFPLPSPLSPLCYRLSRSLEEWPSHYLMGTLSAILLLLHPVSEHWGSTWWTEHLQEIASDCP